MSKQITIAQAKALTNKIEEAEKISSQNILLISLRNNKLKEYNNVVIGYTEEQIKRDFLTLITTGKMNLETILNCSIHQIGLYDLATGIKNTDIKEIISLKKLAGKPILDKLKKEVKNG